MPIIDNIPRFFGTTKSKIIEFDEIAVRNPENWYQWRLKNYEFYYREMNRVRKACVVLDIGAGTSPFGKLFEGFNTYKVDFEPFRGIDFLTGPNSAHEDKRAMYIIYLDPIF